MEPINPTTKTDLEKLLAMGGKELHDLLEKKVKNGTSRVKATKVYQAWLENRGFAYIDGLGWLSSDEVRESGFKLVKDDKTGKSEWCAPVVEFHSEVRGKNGMVEKIRAIDPKALRFFAKRRALMYQDAQLDAQTNVALFDNRIESVARDIGLI